MAWRLSYDLMVNKRLVKRELIVTFDKRLLLLTVKSLFMQYKALYLHLLLLLVFCINGLGAQEITIPSDTTQLLSVETSDGNIFIGNIRKIEPDYLILMTEKFGELRINKKEIRKIGKVGKGQLVGGEYWHDNPQSTRYLFGPNGYGLKRGEGYYQNAWIFFNQVSFGLSNNFTLGVGTIPLFLFSGSPTPFWITPKVSIPIKKDAVNLGIGGLFAVVLGEEGGTFGVAYGQMTFGPRDRNVNLGLGYGYAGDSWASTPTVSLSGVYRASKRVALISENYLFDAGDENVGLLSFGCRFIGRRIAVDAALVFPAGIDEFIGIPWLGLSVPFGNAQVD